MLPQTIDEVIAELSAIIQWAEENNSRLGYFAALYKRVTVAVKQKIEEGYFDDNARMERLDVVFANRYIEAYRQYRAGQKCSISWQLSFNAAQSRIPIVLQHLFLGMNAHIGLDLGIAAATVAPGDSIQALHDDFNKINTVLASLVNTVQNELSDIWWMLKPIDWIAGKLDEEIAAFSMDIARDAAWQVALHYAPLTTPEEQGAYIAARDAKVAAFSQKLWHPGVILSLVLLLIRLGEIGGVRKKIAILNG